MSTVLAKMNTDVRIAKPPPLNLTLTLNLNPPQIPSEKQSVILKSEAIRAEKVNHAMGEAESLTLQAQARATAIEKIALAIDQNVSYIHINILR